MLYIFVKHVISIKFEPATLLEKCFSKISRRKFSDNLRRVTMKSPYGRTSALESLYNEIAGINSSFASLVKKSSHERQLFVNILEFSALLQEGLTGAPFFQKTEGFVLHGCTLLRSWSTKDFFLKLLFFKTASFWYIFQKVSVMSYLNSKQSCSLDTVGL